MDDFKGNSPPYAIIILLFVVMFVPAIVGIVFSLLIYFFVKNTYIKKSIYIFVKITLVLIFIAAAFQIYLNKDFVIIESINFYSESLNEFMWSLGFDHKISLIYSKLFVVLAPLVLVLSIFLTPKFIQRYHERNIGKNPEVKKPKFKRSLFKKYRDSSRGSFIGIKEDTKEPLYFSEQDLGMHCQIIGATGFGKTASALLTRLNYDLKAGKGLIFVDGKGDLESMSQFISLVKEHGRAEDLQVFSPVYTDFSLKYNPLIRGSATEIKDRLIGSQIWSEEFYKKKGEEVILFLCNLFSEIGKQVSFKNLQLALMYPEQLLIKKSQINNEKLRQDFQNYLANHKKDRKNYQGLASDISLISDSDFGHLFDTGDGIDLLTAYQSNKIIYFHLPVLALEESMKRLGRMIIHDLKTVCAYIQTFIHPNDRSYLPVYIDEFASFASESFIELLNKARSAGMAITVIHQSMGDIQKVSDNFSKQIIENTNIKIILRIDDPATIETYCKMIGTKLNIKYTFETSEEGFERKYSGAASAREVDEFIVDPNEFRKLQIGQAIVVVKSKNTAQKVSLDYINPETLEVLNDFSFLKKTDEEECLLKVEKKVLNEPVMSKKRRNVASEIFNI